MTPTIRALTVRQPWASAIADATKTVEVRAWQTHYRGPLLIHAAAKPEPWCPTTGDWPCGVTLAIADLYGCEPIRLAHLYDACLEPEDMPDVEGMWAWLLCDARPVPQVPWRGQQGLWTPPEDLVAQLLETANAKA